MVNFVAKIHLVCYTTIVEQRGMNEEGDRVWSYFVVKIQHLKGLTATINDHIITT